MINNKKVLAVIPARGGSKGIKLKNLRKIHNTPIVVLAGEIGLKTPEIDEVVVSTDNDLIASVSKGNGIPVPFKRPENLSGDRIGDAPVLLHALYEMENIKRTTFDIVVMLQPTSPLRKVEHVSSVIQALEKNNYDSVLTISETDTKSHPLKQLIYQDGKIKFYDERGSKIVARQELSPVYHRNGIAYAIKKSALIKKETLISSNTGAVLVNENCISIDTEFDLEFTEYLFNASF
ncbi:cytidylyltransferase domain-containing protein [Prochlorococcus sp. MIT 1011]|uniref:acylneuraminate cytidylyltransferase family protein n=1 Tax=Prochlorococcus sp. MIT 1011 TaxID=3082520 RepID=UPI0039B40D97